MPQRVLPRREIVVTEMSPANVANRTSSPYERSRLCSQSTPPPSWTTSSSLAPCCSLGPPPAALPPTPPTAYGTHLNTSNRYVKPTAASPANELGACFLGGALPPRKNAPATSARSEKSVPSVYS